MKYYKVEIDEEVWEFIKNQAEPLIDTVNSVLRRLLLGGQSKKYPDYKSADNNFGTLDLPRNIPRALAQILEVIHEVRNNKRQRPEATRIVAQRYGTTPQTILDKYCRQLGKKAYEIDELLDEPDIEKFRHLLVNKFPNYVDLILSILPTRRRLSAESDSIIKKSKPVSEVKKYLIRAGKLYSIDDLNRIDLGKDTRPVLIEINGDQMDVDDWTELCVKFVEWLIMKGILNKSKVPIFNHAKKEKYFINTERKHLFAERDAHWKRVGEFYVDTKYNADAHVKNLMSTLSDLNAGDVELKIAFRD